MAKVVQVGSLLVKHHLVIWQDGVDLIDGGFLGGINRIKKALHAHGKTLADVRRILLTHGHLDHTLNLAKLKSLTSCEIHAPLADRAHLEGSHRYRGWSRVAGWLQWWGRLLLRYQKPAADHWFKAGDLIDHYEVVGLPGHTPGHCGFLLREDGILFAGDLFVSRACGASMPPRIFNDDHETARLSIKKAARLKLTSVFPNHTRLPSAAENRQKLRDLAKGLG